MDAFELFLRFLHTLPQVVREEPFRFSARFLDTIKKACNDRLIAKISHVRQANLQHLSHFG